MDIRFQVMKRMRRGLHIMPVKTPISKIWLIMVHLQIQQTMIFFGNTKASANVSTSRPGLFRDNLHKLMRMYGGCTSVMGYLGVLFIFIEAFLIFIFIGVIFSAHIWRRFMGNLGSFSGCFFDWLSISYKSTTYGDNWSRGISLWIILFILVILRNMSLSISCLKYLK